ncbi:hypothetical protein OIU91_21535 [Streptomyces sp. NBC_01456]|nr:MULTISPECIES: hypothetical protein [unclassified Streptomyces]
MRCKKIAPLPATRTLAQAAPEAAAEAEEDLKSDLKGDSKKPRCCLVER